VRRLLPGGISGLHDYAAHTSVYAPSEQKSPHARLTALFNERLTFLAFPEFFQLLLLQLHQINAQHFPANGVIQTYFGSRFRDSLSHRVSSDTPSTPKRTCSAINAEIRRTVTSVPEITSLGHLSG
jgi:hypothetical protein